MDAIIWFLIFFILLVFEIITLGLATIWFAGGALCAFILAVVGVHNVFIQVAVFLAVSILLLVFTRPLASRYINGRTTKTNVDDIVGKTVKVTEAINNIEALGAVRINGNEWTARSADESIIPVDTIVKIVKVEGVKVIVEQV